jgi:CRP-like cAMP-binding protein
VNGYQQGFRSVASFGFGGQESASKPPQAICKPLHHTKMTEILEKHITDRIGKRPENLDMVIPHFESIKTKRGEHLLNQGDVCRFVYFIVKGCLQVYVLDKNGNESTRSFYFENGWVTDIFGFKNQTPSSEFIKCIEPCELLRIHFEPFQALCSEVPQFDALYKEILEASYNNTVYRVNTLTSLNALERVQWLMETKPLIMTRLSSKLIASYLGISPETLTRLKSKF